MQPSIPLILAAVVVGSVIVGATIWYFMRARFRETLERAPSNLAGGPVPGPGPHAAPAAVAEEVKAIGDQIERALSEQRLQGETQRQLLAQKLDAVRQSVDSQRTHVDGLRSELRHETRRRDAELDEIRAQLGSLQSALALPPADQKALAAPDAAAEPAEAAAPIAAPLAATAAADAGATASTPESAAPAAPIAAPLAPSPLAAAAAPPPAPGPRAEDDDYADPFAEVAFGAPKPASADEPRAADDPSAGDSFTDATFTETSFTDVPLGGDGARSPGQTDVAQTNAAEASDPFGSGSVFESWSPQPTTPAAPAPSEARAAGPAASGPAGPASPESVSFPPSSSPTAAAPAPAPALTPAERPAETPAPAAPLAAAAPPKVPTSDAPLAPPSETLSAPVSLDPSPPESVSFAPFRSAAAPDALAVDEADGEDGGPAAPRPAGPPASLDPAWIARPDRPSPADLYAPGPDDEPVFASADDFLGAPISPDVAASGAPDAAPAADPDGGLVDLDALLDAAPTPLATEPEAPAPAPPAAAAPAADEPAPFVPPEGADDLTVITSVTDDLQRLLYLEGVTSLEEIAQWNRTRARQIALAVQVSEETIMNQWVFEAQAAMFNQFSAQVGL